MTEKLKPCPICGHDVKVFPGEWMPDCGPGPDGYFIRCLTVDCPLEFGFRLIYTDQESGDFKTKQEAAERWNNRFVKHLCPSCDKFIEFQEIEVWRKT